MRDFMNAHIDGRFYVDFKRKPDCYGVHFCGGNRLQVQSEHYSELKWLEPMMAEITGRKPNVRLRVYLKPQKATP